MKIDSQDQSASYKEFEILFRDVIGKKISTNEFIFGFMGISIIVLLSVGFFVGFIVAGLYLALILISPVYDPAYQIHRKLLDLQNIPLHVVKPPLSKLLVSLLSLAVPFFIISIGIRGLSSFGFCSQSIICILIDLI
jgi:hypothetical protein